MFNSYFDKKLSYKKECELKADVKLNNTYDMLFNIVIGMFEYSNYPDSINPDIVESIKLSNGFCAIGKVEGKLVSAIGSFCGNIDNNGFGEEFMGTTLNGTEVSGRIGKDIVILRNNKTYRRDIDDIYNFASDICDVDLSANSNVFFTQIAPLISADDTQTKSKIDEWLKNRKSGIPLTVVRNGGIDIFDSKKSIEVNQLYDSKEVDRLQYLDKHRDELLRRFFNQYGFAMSNSEKLAQQTEKEISVNDGQALIYPYQRLLCAKEDIEKVNKLFGTSIELKFNKLLENKFNKFIIENGGDDNENIGLNDDSKNE